MTNPQQPPIYSSRSALATVYEWGFRPMRIVSTFFPLWEIEAVGTQRQSRPYELIEYFIVQCIGDGKLASAGEIARFLGLVERIVEDSLHVLNQFGHLEQGDGTLTLTDLGQQSLAAGVCYRELKSHRILYFDKFRCRPLLQEHYRLSILPATALQLDHNSRWKPLFPFQQWFPNALQALEQNPERATHNLPDEVQNLSEEKVGHAYLPLYVVEAARPNVRGSHYVVLSGVRGRRDLFFEEIVNTVPDILAPLTAETLQDLPDLIEAELTRRNVSKSLVTLQEVAHNAWRVTLAPEVFRTDSNFATEEIGSYRFIKDYDCYQIWCADVALRREAALDQALATITRWQRTATAQQRTALCQRLAKQLEIAELQESEIRQRAVERGMLDQIQVFDAG